ncbi:cytochrome c biogenesis CcdA family protein [Natronosalvus vescus]|uniref:cytochrome c biogenesis CcdA family protein n=1 Tax=Natronosalvus vescus TaxID=2953881 RepID=UPI0020917639|nr:cytochrome c biogenesis protein CcdA [Natronosalvus vescus]
MFGGELIGTILFALGIGVATFFAPCSYALLPGYVSYYVASTGENSPPLGGAVVRGLAAAAGATTVLVALSAVALVFGEALARVLPFLEYGVGLALILLGAWVLWGGTGSIHVLLPERRSSRWGFAVFGGMYALAATACVLPVFLALALRSVTMAPLETALVLGSYAGGFGVLMLSVTVATAVGYDVGSQWTRNATGCIVRIAGIVLIAAGIGQLYLAGA